MTFAIIDSHIMNKFPRPRLEKAKSLLEQKLQQSTMAMERFRAKVMELKEEERRRESAAQR
jgi:hypothetical protein